MDATLDPVHVWQACPITEHHSQSRAVNICVQYCSKMRRVPPGGLVWEVSPPFLALSGQGPCQEFV